MKKVIVLALLGCFLALSCKTVHTTSKGNVPPGQMKKITGSKSAKAYAPGQQKSKP